MGMNWVNNGKYSLKIWVNMGKYGNETVYSWVQLNGYTLVQLPEGVGGPALLVHHIFSLMKSEILLAKANPPTFGL